MLHDIAGFAESSELVIVMAAISGREAHDCVVIIAIVVKGITGADIVTSTWSLDTELMAHRFTNVDMHLRVPVRNQVDPRRVESGSSVNVLGELGHGFDQM